MLSTDDFAAHFQICEKLGEGRFGRVFKCRDVETEEDVAAKFIQVSHQLQKVKIENEVKILRKLSNKRIIRLVKAFVQPADNQYIIVTEIIYGGELFDRLVDDEFILTEKVVMKFVRQICEAVRFMHSKHVLHLDLKPENILCSSPESTKIKIIDFGLSKEFKGEEEIKVMAGTAEFSAPEVIGFEVVGPYTDMWALGVITYLLLSGISPFLGETDAETYINVTKGHFAFDTEEFAVVSNTAKEFVTTLLAKDVKQRATAKQCLQDAWLVKTKSNKKLRNKRNLKRYVIRRRWKKALHAITALKRMGWNPTFNGTLT